MNDRAAIGLLNILREDLERLRVYSQALRGLTGPGSRHLPLVCEIEDLLETAAETASRLRQNVSWPISCGETT